MVRLQLLEYMWQEAPTAIQLGVSSEHNSLVTVFVFQKDWASNCQAKQTTLRGVVCGVVCSVGCSDLRCCIMCGEWCGLRYGAICLVFKARQILFIRLRSEGKLIQTRYIDLV